MSCILSVILAASITAAPAAKADFAFKEVNGTGLELSDGGQPVFVYNFGMVSSDVKGAVTRCGYLHPVYAPNGVVITDDFNPNHQHHRGISWMWQDITVDGKNGDIWTLKKGFELRFVRFKAKEANSPTAKLAIEDGWFDGDKKFVKEDVEIVTHGVEPSAAGGLQRQLDFTIRVEAIDKPVDIVGTSEGNKGFGGFCFRLAPRDVGSKTIIRTDKGISAKDQEMGRNAWAEVAGTFHGKQAWGRIDDLEGNPGFPQNGWLLRHGFGFMNVSYPGRTRITLQPGKPLELKYRVTLGSGEPPTS